MAKKYDASSIDVHLGLDQVRANLNIYLGNPDSAGILHLIKEIFDNANDETKDGHGKYFGVSIADDGNFWVYDAGRGIPVDIHPKTKQSTLTTVLTNLSAGGKMRKGDASSYGKGSTGVHGMGAAVVNAASEEFIAYVFRKRWYRQVFKKGKPVSKVEKCNAPKVPGAPAKLAKRDCGTVICFRPDMSLFDKGSKLSLNNLAKILDLTAYLNPKAKIFLTAKGKEKIFYHPEGLKTFLNNMIAKREVEPLGKAFSFQSDDIAISIQWTAYDEETISSFVNGSPTTEGGTHIQGLNKSINEALKDYRPAKSTFKPEDLRIGLLGVFNFNLQKPRFSTQTKTKLITPEANDIVVEQLTPEIKKFFAANKTLAKNIIKRAQDLRDAFDEWKVSKKAAAELKTTVKGRVYLPEKLAVALTKNPKEKELYVVEGDSAKGPCTQARFKQFQEVMPLKGKITNVFKAKAETAMANPDIIEFLKAVGYDPSKKDPFSSLRVGKVIFLFDADEDGKHISVLSSGLFYKFLRPIIESGNLYVGRPPLFAAKVGSKSFYGDTLEEVQKNLPAGKHVPILRMKGLGEASVTTLKYSAFDPETRNLTRLTLPKGEDGARKYMSMLNEDVAARKTLLGLG